MSAVQDDTAPQIRTPDQRVRVFISSTLGELAPERAAVRKSIEQLRLIPVLFELGARPHPPRELYRAYLRQSHIFVGIYWERYGWIAPGEDISGLEDELVLSDQMPRLMYVKEPAPEREARLTQMIDRFDDQTSVRTFSTPEELAGLVQEDLALLLTERFESTAQHDTEQANDTAATDGLSADAPLPLTQPVGREDDIRSVAEMLHAGLRLVTLIGPGGIGKSRLALEIARRIKDDFGGGVQFVMLEQIADPALMLRSITEQLHVRVEGDQTPLDALVDSFGDTSRLLMLDNFEHIISAAPDIAALLERVGSLQILVTSRQVLHLRSEYDYPVAPLTVPAPDALPEELGRSSAVSLFVQRATAANAHFETTPENMAAIAELCRRLDGLPLAIELAAARVRVLPPPALLERLRDRLDLLRTTAPDLPERHRAMGTTLDWSFDLLSAPEQALLERMSVFSGGAVLEAIEAVCNFDGGIGDVLEIASSLLEKSLLMSVAEDTDAQPRLRLLKTIRSYAGEKLDEGSEREELRGRHLEWFTRLARIANIVEHPDATRSWPTMTSETENFRLAVQTALDHSDVPALAELGFNLWSWYWLSARVPEARRWLEQAWSLTDDSTAAEDRAMLQIALGHFRAVMGDFDDALGLLNSALEFFADNELLSAGVRMLRFGVLTGTGHEEEATADVEAALEVVRRHGNLWMVGYAGSMVGAMRALRGDPEGARQAQNEALAAARAIDQHFLEAQLLTELAMLAISSGDLDTARAHLLVTADVVQRSGNVEGVAHALDAVAMLAASEGRIPDAAVALHVSDEIRERLKLRIWPMIAMLRQQMVSGVASALPPADELPDARLPFATLRALIASDHAPAPAQATT